MNPLFLSAFSRPCKPAEYNNNELQCKKCVLYFQFVTFMVTGRRRNAACSKQGCSTRVVHTHSLCSSLGRFTNLEYVKSKSPQNTSSCSDLIFSKIKPSQKKGRSWRNKQQGEALMRNELVIAFQALQLDWGHWGHFTGVLSPPQVRASTKLWGCKQLQGIWVQTRGRQG